MQTKADIRFNIFSLLVIMTVIPFIAGGIVFIFSGKFNRTFDVLMKKDMAAYDTAANMQLAIANQKGYLTYYYIDNNPTWLEDLGIQRENFNINFQKALSLATDPVEKELLNDIDKSYKIYINLKDKVIQIYKNNIHKEISDIHIKQRIAFFDVLNLCEKLKHFHWEAIKNKKADTSLYAFVMRLMSVGAALLFICLSLILSFILIKQILDPVEKFIDETSSDSSTDVKLKGQSLNLIFDKAHTELVKSRENLEQSEKMAMVGKIAAGMAHTIRNPFTSIKMRLFSLNRSLALMDEQQEDFDVISQEIHRIDNILQNFLEFSRSPKLKIKQCDPSKIIEATILLLQHRIQAYDIEVKYIPMQKRVFIDADSELLKEALINIILNGCEAIQSNGMIIIKEETLLEEDSNKYLSIQVIDTGPGIPDDIKDKIVQPFYTTKEDGTGLGLSIAKKIIEQHNGKLEFSSCDKGTIVKVNIPFGYKFDEQNIDN